MDTKEMKKSNFDKTTFFQIFFQKSVVCVTHTLEAIFQADNLILSKRSFVSTLVQLSFNLKLLSSLYSPSPHPPLTLIRIYRIAMVVHMYFSTLPFLAFCVVVTQPFIARLCALSCPCLLILPCTPVHRSVIQRGPRRWARVNLAPKTPGFRG